jgi:hypothetical protein
MEPRKQAILNALSAFANQRPGLDPRNYISHGMDSAGRAAYRAEVRSITKDLHHARTLLRAVELSDGITADDLIKASTRAFSGRLTIAEDAPGTAMPFTLDYCTGQYWPTEYRRAVAAVCASALWDYTREKCMPPATWHVDYEDGTKYHAYSEQDARDHWARCAGRNERGAGNLRQSYGKQMVSAGDWLRAHFRQQFGRGIASRWFS